MNCILKSAGSFKTMTGTLLHRLFNIHQAETKKGLTLALFYFSAGVYAVVVESVAYAVFNVRFGVKYLPYVFLIVPYLNLAVSLFMIKRMTVGNQRVIFRYVILMVLFVQILGFVILKGVFSPKIIYGLFFILAFTVLENLILSRTFLLQSILDMDSVKRLAPIAASGFAVGAIIAGYVLSILKGFIPNSAILLAVTVFLLLMAYYGDVLYKKYRIIDEGPVEQCSYTDSAKFLLKNPFYLVVTLLVATLFITSNINSYLFNNLLTNTFHNEGRITAVLGTLTVLQFIMSLIINLFLFSRIVHKIGTFNMMKLVLINGIVGMALLILGERLFICALLSRAVLTILVINLGDLLLDLMYQPVPQRYRDKVISLIYFVFSCVGFTIGGLITIFHSQGLIGVNYLYLFSISLLILNYILWKRSQSSFILAIKQNVNLSTSVIDMNMLFGQLSVKEHRSFLTAKIRSGNSTEKRFVLQFFKQINFPGKEPLLEQVFKNSSLEVRLEIVNMIFNGSISERILQNSKVEIDLALMQYLIENTFLLGDDRQNLALIPIVADIGRHFAKEQFAEPIRLMYEYLFEAKSANYELLLQMYSKYQRSDDYLYELRIMKSHSFSERRLNQKYLGSLMEDAPGNSELLKAALDLCALYDLDLDWFYLKTVFSACADYQIMEQICNCYRIDEIRSVLGEQKRLIPSTILLFAARKQPQAVKEYEPLYRQVLAKLELLVTEKLKIENSAGPGRDLLLVEINPIIRTVAAVLIDYQFLLHRHPLINNPDKHLGHSRRRMLILETVKNSLPMKVADELLALVNEEITISSRETTFLYESLDIGDRNSFLRQTYMYFGGEKMPDQFCNEVEHMILLKSVPLFGDLNVETLYQLLKITRQQIFGMGKIIIHKGEVGDTFYVV
jgi:hypothetical protein